MVFRPTKSDKPGNRDLADETPETDARRDEDPFEVAVRCR